MIVRDFIKAKGYGDNFSHGLGHGVGLEIHEDPSLSFKSDMVLRDNMVVMGRARHIYSGSRGRQDRGYGGRQW